MILKDLIPVIHSNFEIYYNGQNQGGVFNYLEKEIYNDSFKWLLNLKVLGVETDDYPIIAIYV